MRKYILSLAVFFACIMACAQNTGSSNNEKGKKEFLSKVVKKQNSGKKDNEKAKKEFFSKVVKKQHTGRRRTSEEDSDTILSDEMDYAAGLMRRLDEAVAAKDSVAIEHIKDTLQWFDFVEIEGGTIIDTTEVDGDVASGNEDYAPDYGEDEPGVGGHEAAPAEEPTTIQTRSGFIARGKESTTKIIARGRKELAVVAEAGGRVTLNISITDKKGVKKNQNDTKDVRAGRSYRKAVLNLSDSSNSTVVLKIINCSNKDIHYMFMYK